VFFRAENISHAKDYLVGIFSESLFSPPLFAGGEGIYILLVVILIFIVIEWYGRDTQYGLEKIGLKCKKPFSRVVYYALLYAIIYQVITDVMGSGEAARKFIYFQF
jgi:hypothetical protein